MIGVWLFLPVVIVSALAIAVAIRALAAEAARFAEELTKVQALKPAFIALREDTAATAEAVRQLRVARLR